MNEYKYEIERLTRELQDVKRRYYEQKRREQLTNAPEQPKGRQSLFPLCEPRAEPSVAAAPAAPAAL